MLGCSVYVCKKIYEFSKGKGVECWKLFVLVDCDDIVVIVDFLMLFGFFGIGVGIINVWFLKFFDNMFLLFGVMEFLGYVLGSSVWNCNFSVRSGGSSGFNGDVVYGVGGMDEYGFMR